MSRWISLVVGAIAVCSSLRAEPQPAPHQATMPHPEENCSNLSAAEQEFASKLSQLHRQIFCGHFNGNQRAQVLALMVSKSSGRQPMTPDGAVEAVITAARETEKQDPSSQGEAKAKKPPPPRTSYRSSASRRSCGRRTT